MIAILIVAFLLFFVLLYHLNNLKLIDTFISSTVVFSTLIAITTETLSFFNCLTIQGVTNFWISATILLLLINQKFKIQYSGIGKNIAGKLTVVFKKQSRIELTLLALTTLVYLTVYIQGLIYPPNNWDSLSYHMPRITEWLSHGNLENYPTHIIRQLYQPTLCEYFILHFNALARNDFFSNSVQFFFLLGTIGATIGLIKLIFNKINYILALIITATIPHALLEASSTQNDIVHSCFIVISTYFGFKLIINLNRKDFLLFGLAIGLALLAKAIAYIYLPIIAGVISIIILIKVITSKSYKIIIPGFMSILLIIAINFPHSYRNYSLSKDIMGSDKKEKADYLNEEFSPKLILSTVIKNIGLHFDSFYVGNLGNQLVEKSHILIGQNINAKGSNVFDMKYNCNHDWKNHEDTQPNFIHFTLFSLSILVLLTQIIRRKELNKYLILLNIIVIISFVFFCAMLTWEPWNTRLHLPLFFLMCPSIYFTINVIKIKHFRNIIILQFILYGFYIIAFNYSRPFITNRETSKIKCSDDRFKKYFANQPQLYNDYVDVQKKLVNAKTIGLMISLDTWEYPFYYKYLNKKIIPIHINVENFTKTIQPKNVQPDYIISNTQKAAYLYFKGRKYRNICLKNKTLSLYK
jgi:hypothetical protein